jgi:hypothetical protein
MRHFRNFFFPARPKAKVRKVGTSRGGNAKIKMSGKGQLPTREPLN